jgi:hypothetical protein
MGREAFERDVEHHGPVSHGLLERREEGIAACPLQRLFEGEIPFGGGSCAEVYIEHNLGYAQLHKSIQHIGMNLARPRPHPYVLQAFGVDLNEKCLAGRTSI